MFFLRVVISLGLLGLVAAAPANAQERPYFVTYDHYLEEAGNLEIALLSTTGVPRGSHASYTAPWLELEYGVTGWWTSELYVEGVTTGHDGSAFTGWRWENRFRALKGEHRLNPIIYIEYENINEASRIQKEIVGKGALSSEPVSDLRRQNAHEFEGKLILSSVAGAWNVSENFIVEKNLSAHEGLEFGYGIGISRSLGGLASSATCHLCREGFVAGVEAYGSLGRSDAPGLSDTRHFIAPVFGWHVTDHTTLKVSAAFGVSEASDSYLLRLGWAYELPNRGGRR